MHLGSVEDRLSGIFRYMCGALRVIAKVLSGWGEAQILKDWSRSNHNVVRDKRIQ